MLKKDNPVDSFDYEIDSKEATTNDETLQLTFKKKITNLIDELKKKPALIIALVFLVILTLSMTIMGVYTYSVAKQLQAQALPLKDEARKFYELFKSQNLPEAEVVLNQIDSDFQEVKSTYQKLSFYSKLPIASNYYNDGLHGINAAQAGIDTGKKTIAAITPYADVLGFSGAEFTGGTTEDRLKVILETLEKISPILDEIGIELNTAKDELAMIDAKRYPESIKDIPVREYVVTAQDLSAGAANALSEYRPVIEQLPSVAGAGGEQKEYLILFQNDNELRPTGGFLTAYAIIKIQDGKVEAQKSDDIYELDQKFTKRLPIPEALGKYLTTEKYWHLRDMNISPDFKLSMEQFYEQYKTVRGEPTDIDGIIAVDTKVLTDLLSVLGPVQVPAYGTFSAEPDNRCDGCAQVVYALSEIITKPTPYLREDRKGILGPLMQSTLQKAYSAPKEKWPELFQLMWGDLEGKHIQLYFTAEQAQTAAETVNAAGRMIAQENGNDFLAIINANLGGAKSNLFVNYDVKQEILIPESGMLEKSVEITYRNTRKADNCNLEAGKLCLNSTLRDWTRLYIPAGSELISAQGFTTEPVTYEENGMQVIDGFFILEPLGSAKLKLTYKVPYTDEKTYRIHLWKQGGVDDFETLFDVNGGEEKILVNKDSLVEIPF